MIFGKPQAEMRETPKEALPRWLKFKECHTQFQPKQRLTSLSYLKESKELQKWHKGIWRRQLTNPGATTTSNKVTMQPITTCARGLWSSILKTQKLVTIMGTVTWNRASLVLNASSLALAWFLTPLISSMTKTGMLVTDSLPDLCTLVNEA